MGLRNRAFLIFIVILYLSLLILDWGALRIVENLTLDRGKHYMVTETEKVHFFLDILIREIRFIEKSVYTSWLKSESLDKNIKFSSMNISVQPIEQQVQNTGSDLKFVFTRYGDNADLLMDLTSIWHEKDTGKQYQFKLLKSIGAEEFNRHLQPVSLDFMIYDLEGRQVASWIAHQFLVNLSLESLKPEIRKIPDDTLQEILNSKTGVFFDDFSDSDNLTYFSLYRNEGKNFIILAAVYPLKSLADSRATLKSLTVAVLSFVTIILAIFTYFLVHRARRYFNHLYHFTQKVAQGDFALRLKTDDYSEYEPLNRLLNDLISSLQKVKKFEDETVLLDRLNSLAVLSRGIAHEIKNPLMVLKYSTSHLRKQIHDEGVIEDIVMLERNINRIEAVVRKIADFSRPLTDEKMEVHDLTVLFNEVFLLLRKTCENNDISVVIAGNETSQLIRAQKNSVFQVITNVILNAIESMSGGGELSIEIHRKFNEKAGKNFVEIVVTDTGCGIEADLLDKVFTPFYSTKDTGTGLGLAITYRIMQEHKGYIELSSSDVNNKTEEGKKGTVVRIGFPLEES